MKRISLILVFLAIGCILLFQAGCQKADKSAQQSEPVVQTPEKATPAVAQKAPEPAKIEPKPKPAPVKAKPVPDKPKLMAERPKPVVAKKPRPVVKKATVKVDPNAPVPRIKFAKTAHNFGNMDPGSNNICEYEFTNVGEALLKIIKVKPDCGCTQFTLEKKEYAPGESGVLKFKYHAISRAGSVSRRIVVTTNDPIEPDITLTIKGKVVELVGYEPKKLNLLLKNDDTLYKVTLTSLDGRPFSIKGVKSSVNSITADFDPAVEATKFVLELKVDRTKLQRVSSGIVEFALSHPAAKSITVPFSALTRFKINPPTIILFDSVTGKPVIRNGVTILNNYKEDFEIESVKSKTGITKVVKREKIRYGHRFSLQIVPPDSGGKQRFSDDILFQVKDGELLTIRCQGFYKRKKK